MESKHKVRTPTERRIGDRRNKQVEINGTDRRKVERRSGTDRRT
ncbi:hypothetical protein [Qipengyuania sp. RANM35]